MYIFPHHFSEIPVIFFTSWNHYTQHPFLIILSLSIHAFFVAAFTPLNHHTPLNLSQYYICFSFHSCNLHAYCHLHPLLSCPSYTTQHDLPIYLLYYHSPLYPCPPFPTSILQPFSISTVITYSSSCLFIINNLSSFILYICLLSHFLFITIPYTCNLYPLPLAVFFCLQSPVLTFYHQDPSWYLNHHDFISLPSSTSLS